MLPEYETLEYSLAKKYDTFIYFVFSFTHFSYVNSIAARETYTRK